MKETITAAHTRITDSIIAAIEAGPGIWEMPWHRGGEGLNRPVNVDSKNVYPGENRVLLWFEALNRGYSTGIWGTRRQWKRKGCQVRAGEPPCLVIHRYRWGKEENERDDLRIGEHETGETENGWGRHTSEVFNADQVDGYMRPCSGAPKAPVQIDRCHMKAERFIADTDAVIRHGGGDAYYDLNADVIRMPDRERFFDSNTSTANEAYLSTKFHELIHWTGAESRCNRRFGRFGDDNYAREELVAELGAAFLCADHGVTLVPRDDHARYIDHWLGVLRSDSKAIFTAARRAEKAIRTLKLEVHRTLKWEVHRKRTSWLVAAARRRGQLRRTAAPPRTLTVLRLRSGTLTASDGRTSRADALPFRAGRGLFRRLA